MSGCGSSRPVPAARREARVPNKHFAFRTLSGFARKQGKQGDFLRGRARGRTGKAVQEQAQKCVVLALRENWRGWPVGQWVWGPSLLPNGKRPIAGLGHYSPRIPGGFTLPHRSDETLGRGPRSEPRAPMQMNGQRRSRQFQFRV